MQNETAYPNIFRIKTARNEIATGFLINKEGYIFTVAHIFENGIAESVECQNTTMKFNATLVHRSSDVNLDFAVLKAEENAKLPAPLMLNTEAVTDNLNVFAYGYGEALEKHNEKPEKFDELNLTKFGGKVSLGNGYSFDKVDNLRYVIEGDSGAPLFCERSNTVVGISYARDYTELKAQNLFRGKFSPLNKIAEHLRLNEITLFDVDKLNHDKIVESIPNTETQRILNILKQFPYLIEQIAKYDNKITQIINTANVNYNTILQNGGLKNIFINTLNNLPENQINEIEKQSQIFNYLGIAKNLKAENVLQPARLIQKSLNTYYKRDFDNVLHNDFANNKHIIIVAQSLAGKTRAVFDLLKKEEFENCRIIFPYSTAFADIETISSYTDNDTKNILILDDIDEYILPRKENKFLNLLQQAFNPGSNIQIIATCKTGIEEFAFYNEKISGKLKENFTELFIAPIEKEDIQAIEKKLNIKINSNSFDRTIGSIFLDLEVMTHRYRNLTDTQKKILLAVKILYLTNQKTNYDSYDLFKIKRLTEEDNIEQSVFELKNNLGELRSKKDKLSFIYLYDASGDRNFELCNEEIEDLYIYSEIAYLEKIISPEFDFYKAVLKIFKIYGSTEELEKNGFANLTSKLGIYLNSLDKKEINTESFNKLLSKVKNLQEKITLSEYIPAILAKLAPNIDSASQILKAFPNLLNEFSYSTLISKAPDYKTSLEWFEEMKTENIKPNEVSYSTLISKAPDYKTSLEWFEKMKAEKIKPNEVSYNTLISKAPDYKTSLEWFEEMKAEKIKLDEFSYSTLIKKAPDYKTSLEWFEEMKAEKIKPNEFSYNTLISKAPDYKTSLEWFEEMKAEKIKLDEFSYSTLISKAPDYKTSLEWFEEMKAEKIKPNEVSYSTLISKALDYKTSLEWFEEMKAEKIKPNEFSYSTLISKAPDYKTSLEWFEEMKAEKIKPNEVSYNTLIKKAPDYKTSLEWFEEMKAEKIKPNEVSYNTLIKKAPDYKTSLEWFKEMKAKKIKPNEFSYSTLISNAPDYKTSLEWFKEMKAKKIKPNEFSYSTLISKAPDYKTSLEWFEEMKAKKIKPNEFSYSTLISKAPDYKTSLEWFEKMKIEKIKPNEFSYSTLISKAPDYKTSLEWFEKMKTENIKPNEVSYNTLISKAPDYKTSLEWFEEMKSEKIKPNEFSYSTLISKAPDYKTSLEWFEEMKAEKIKPNIYSYTTLIKKSGNETIALSLLEDIKDNTVRPNAVTFGTYLQLAGRDLSKQQELIQEFLSIFEIGKDFGMREFKSLRMHPMPILIFAEEIYTIAPNQKKFICMLLENVKQSLENRYISVVNERYLVLSAVVNCSKGNK